MNKAYTVIYGINDVHWNVGPTYEREQDALQDVTGIDRYGVIPVVSWVDDYEQIDRGVLLWRTDGIHESSWVVAEEPTELSDTANEGAVGTTLVSAAEAENVE